MNRFILAFLACVAGLVPALADDTLTGQNAFGPNDISNVTHVPRVTMMTSPPSNDGQYTSDYDYYPMNIISTQAVSAQVRRSGWSGGITHFLWADRGDADSNTHTATKNAIYPDPKNFGATRQCRASFSTFDKAMAATEVKVAYTVGREAHVSGSVVSGVVNYSTAGYLDIANAAGYSDSDVAYWATIQTNYSTWCGSWDGTYDYMTDKIWLPENRIVDFVWSVPDGVTIDYEPHDGRSDSQTTTLFSHLWTMVHGAGLKLVIYTNPLNGTAFPYNGMSSGNINTIMTNYCDYFSVLIWYGNDEASVTSSLANQLAKLDGPSHNLSWSYSKLQMIFELGKPDDSEGTTTADATAMRSELETHSWGGVIFWNDGAERGGQLSRTTNQKIAILLGLPTS